MMSASTAGLADTHAQPNAIADAHSLTDPHTLAEPDALADAGLLAAERRIHQGHFALDQQVTGHRDRHRHLIFRLRVCDHAVDLELG